MTVFKAAQFARIKGPLTATAQRLATSAMTTTDYSLRLADVLGNPKKVAHGGMIPDPPDRVIIDKIVDFLKRRL